MTRFYDAFRERHGARRCRDLPGCDINTPEGLKEAQGKNLFRTSCEQFVKDAALMVEEAL